MTQPRPFREQVKALEHLQELDQKIDHLKKQKAGLPALTKSLDDGFNRSRMAVEAKKNSITEVEKTERQTQAAMDLNKDRLARASSKLESVQNSQEFQAANKEIDQLKKLNASLEEQLKKSKQDHESLNKEFEDLSMGFKKVQDERNVQLEQVTGQSSELDAQIGSLMKERQKYVPDVDQRVLSQYDRVRGARGGIGFVPAVGGRCSGCNMMVPPQLFNEVQRGNAVHACPSCHRILFVPTPSPEATSSAR